MSEIYPGAIGGKPVARLLPGPTFESLPPRTYLLILLLPTLFLLLVAIPWIRYSSVAPGKWMMPEMDYRYTLRDVKADVVVYGDSTGVVSLDPLVMQQDLHASVQNIAGLTSIFNIQSDDILDHYLRYNQAPRLLVISLSPWGLRPDPISVNNSYEGIVMLVRHGSWQQVMAFSRTHPWVMVYFEFQALRSLLDPTPNRDPDLRGELVEHRGFAPISQTPLTAPCRVLQKYTDPLVPGGLALHFYNKYSSAQTKVLVLMAPVPDCAGSVSFRDAHQISPWIVPSPIVPPGQITVDGRHMEGTAATAYSHSADLDIEKYLTRTGIAIPTISSALEARR